MKKRKKTAKKSTIKILKTKECFANMKNERYTEKYYPDNLFKCRILLNSAIFSLLHLIRIFLLPSFKAISSTGQCVYNLRNWANKNKNRHKKIRTDPEYIVMLGGKYHPIDLIMKILIKIKIQKTLIESWFVCGNSPVWVHKNVNVSFFSFKKPLRIFWNWN